MTEAEFREALAAVGPFECESRADGTVLVKPSWSAWPPYSEDDGGGPGVGSRMGFAMALQNFLNGESGC